MKRGDYLWDGGVVKEVTVYFKSRSFSKHALIFPDVDQHNLQPGDCSSYFPHALARFQGQGGRVQ